MHSVVPIGGAPFVPPLITMFHNDGVGAMAMYEGQHDDVLASSSASSSPTIHQRRKSAASDGGASSGSASSASTPRSSTHQRDSSASPSAPVSPSSSSSASSTPVWRDALRYSSSMQEHTRRMWQMERLNIERTRFAVAQDSSASASSPSSAQAHPAAVGSPLQKRGTISGSVDALFRGRRSRHAKTNSLV